MKKAGKIPIKPASIPENTASFLDLKCLVARKQDLSLKKHLLLLKKSFYILVF